ncbi:MAG TPA: alpha/beta hydrolase [Lacunisphaera sp.]|jgi:phospholipase/carboxylesterase|nr:alpha/beta hydrolase [Lacunisphaera sp.]HQY06368.1 alpha/beta hydrolase [Lacunisphaera sp.]
MSSLSYHHRFEHGTDPSAPLLLLLHGTGGDENDLIPLGRKLSPGSTLLSPRGDVIEHDARRFFARLSEGVFDPAEVTRRTNALADFIIAAGKHYRFDPAILTSIGFSNGANIAATLLLLRPETLGSAVLLRPMFVLEPPQPPDLKGRRVFLSSGTVDPIVPNNHPIRLADLLRRSGADVTLQTVPASHGLVSADLAGARDFLARRPAVGR